MPASPKLKARRAAQFACGLCLCLLAEAAAFSQAPPAAAAPSESAGAGGPGTPIAIVPLNGESADSAATVTGALEVTGGKAIIAASGSISSGSRTTSVVLPHRGVLRVCAGTTVKLAADTSVPAGGDPGLLIAMDHGAVETSFATGRNADILLTPDFRILIGGPGASEVKLRLGRDGDTCVDNSSANAPYVVVTSLFDSGLYRVQPGQRVMFQHGSLREVVDQEQEPCGCPPAAAPPDTAKNEFPLAQSEGLAPTPAPAPAQKLPASPAPQAVTPLVFSNPVSAPPPVAAAPTPPAASAAPPATSSAPQTPQKKKPGFFKRIGHFFRRVFGAES
ncbi:MAG TPA: hypothetical protein VGG26_10845 [Terracidiphilus sp.]|jgi:hypothetical protein